jgi:iron complex outermembrane receptor protein
LISTAFGAAALAQPGMAQNNPSATGNASARTPAQSTGIEEVVVTATRQSMNANRVPLSIAAVTQRSLDEQGIKSASDLTRVVPELTLVNQTAGLGTFAIRGITATVGAATTSVYLDDTSLTKRTNPGGAQQGPGSPIPTLFDLQRVEVLKGPQGTLYGGSSEGGTIRFITPTPSLTTYSGMARVEVSSVENGQLGHEYGVAVGGPILQDKIGFRISGVDRKTGGWIDVVNPYTGQIANKDDNGRAEQALRGVLLFQINDRAKATFAAYHSTYINQGGPDSSTQVYSPNGQLASASQTYTTPATCYNNNGRAPGASSAPTAVTCPAVLPAGWFRRAPQTYGPWTLRQDQSMAPFTVINPPNNHLSGGKTTNDVGSMTLDYAFDRVALKSITSYIQDVTFSGVAEGNDPARLQSVVENPGHLGFPLFAPLQDYFGQFQNTNQHHGIEQEVRLSSSDPTARLTWVGGLFYSDSHTHINYIIDGNYDNTDLAFYGLTSQQRYGIPNPGGYVSLLDAQLHDTELAGFGEANLAITSKLKATLGVRVSRVGLTFSQANYGQLSGRPDVNAPFAFVQGSATDTPVTPKYGVQYNFTSNDMVYLTAAKGFRAGGVNVPLNPQTCGLGLAVYGLTVNDIPKQYGPDSVWSYEAGGKFRLLDNTLQLNAAVFQIDWSQIQVTTTAQGCGQSWNQNGGSARSRGVDFQSEYRPNAHFLLTSSVGYTDAYYTAPVLGPKPLVGTPAITYNAGDPLGVPVWQAALGARYDLEVVSLPSYIRADLQYRGAFVTGPSVGSANYNPFTRNIPSNVQVNLRGGVTYKRWDINLFANNVFDARGKIGVGGNGQSSCNAITGGPACTVYAQFTPFVENTYQMPRLVGVQANYRF